VQQVLTKSCEARIRSGRIGLQFPEGELQDCCGKPERSSTDSEWSNKFSQGERLILFRREQPKG
jgi:hypothetical protein